MKRPPSASELHSHSLHTCRVFLGISSGSSKLQAAATMLGQYYSLSHSLLKPCSRRLMKLQNSLAPGGSSETLTVAI